MLKGKEGFLSDLNLQMGTNIFSIVDDAKTTELRVEVSYITPEVLRKFAVEIALNVEDTDPIIWRC